MANTRLNATWWILKIALGLVTFLAGLDKFFNRLTNWNDHLNPAALEIAHVTPELFLQCVGVAEMVVGIAILTRWTKLGAYLAALWLAANAANLITMGRYLDVAVNDLVLSVAAFALARLTEARRSEPVNSVATRVQASPGGILRLNI